MPERCTGGFRFPGPGPADPLELRRRARHTDPGLEPRGWRKWWDEAVSDQDATYMEVSASEDSPPENWDSHCMRVLRFFYCKM